MVEYYISTSKDTIFQTTTEQSTMLAAAKGFHCYCEIVMSEEYITNKKKGLGEERMTSHLTIPEGQSNP